MQLDELNHLFFRLQLTGKHRRRLYVALALMARNQVDIHQAVRRLYRVVSRNGKSPKRVTAMMLQDVIVKLKSGWTMAEALGLWVPNDERMLIQAGELSGRLASGYDHAVVLIDAKQKIRQAVFKAATYPVFLVVALGFLLNLLAVKVVPQLERVVPEAAWRGAAWALRSGSHAIHDYGVWLAALGVIGSLVVFTTLGHFTGKVRQWVENIPPWSVYRLVHGSMFLLTVAVLMKDGVPVKLALDAIAKKATPWLTERVRAIAYGLGVGSDFAQGLANSGFDFPDPEAIEYVDMLGQQSGFQEALYQYSQEWLREGIQRIDSVGKVLMSAGIMLVGAMVAVLFLGIQEVQQAMVK
jgi:type II secretory pathway component PulF